MFLSADDDNIGKSQWNFRQTMEVVQSYKWREFKNIITMNRAWETCANISKTLTSMCNWNPGTREEKNGTGKKIGRNNGQKSLISFEKYKYIISMIQRIPSNINLSKSWSKFWKSNTKNWVLKAARKKMTKYVLGNKDSLGHSLLIRNYSNQKTVEQHRQVLKGEELKALEILIYE